LATRLLAGRRYSLQGQQIFAIPPAGNCPQTNLTVDGQPVLLQREGVPFIEPCPPGSDGGCRFLMSKDYSDDFIRSRLPDSLNKRIDQAGKLIDTFKGAVEAVQFAAAVATFLGILEPELTLQEAYERLHRDIFNLGTALSKQQNNSQIAQRISQSYSAVLGIEQGPILPNSAPDQESRAAALWGTSPSSYERFHDPTAIAGSWQNLITERPAVDSGLVWDWRIGLPQMLHLIAMRLAVIAAIDNNFVRNGQYRTELFNYLDALRSVRQKMTGGLICKFHHEEFCEPFLDGILGMPPECVPESDRFYFELACADIYTGAGAYESGYAYGLSNLLSYGWERTGLILQKINHKLPLGAIDEAIATLEGLTAVIPPPPPPPNPCPLGESIYEGVCTKCSDIPGQDPFCSGLTPGL
jgi:hypothetical protein